MPDMTIEEAIGILTRRAPAPAKVTLREAVEALAAQLESEGEQQTALYNINQRDADGYDTLECAAQLWELLDKYPL